MHILCHFEMFADDPEGLADFYREIFDWQIVDAFDGYKFINTGGGKDAAGGGIEKSRSDQKQLPVNYFLVESIEDHLIKIEKAGGTVLKGKSPVPGYGYFSIIKDPEDNKFGLWQTDRTAK